MPPTKNARALTRLLAPAVVSALVVATAATPAEAVVFRKTFSQATPILVGDGGSGPTDSFSIPDSGPASAYPSQGSVNDGAGRPIIDVDVYVQLEHTDPDDVEVLLVGPGGQQALLMANAGSGTDFSGSLVFDDEAASAIPDSDPLVNGTSYKPAAYSPTDLPGAPPLTGNNALSVFDGRSAIGEWSLYVFDDAAADSGTFYWAARIETGTVGYPSTVAVSGLGTVTDVNVNLSGVTSTWPDDLDLMLVGPQGQQATLMSDVGGSLDISAENYTVDDEAANPFPDAGVLVSGSYQPANIDESEDIYPAPAPATTGTTALSVFDGTDPNGTWKLFAWDRVGGDYTTINGWSLDIESNDATGPSGTVSIAAGAALLDAPAVTLTLAANDPAPGTGLQQMRFSNDNQAFSAWQPYATTAAWTLATGKDGARTVYAQFADGVGNVSSVVSDTVTLDTTAPTAKKISPAKNAQGVSAKTKIKVTASEKLDPATVTKKSVLLKQGSKKIKAKVSLKKGTTIVLKPKKPLADGTYKVTVTTLVTDLVGHAFDAKKKKGIQTLKWKFTV